MPRPRGYIFPKHLGLIAEQAGGAILATFGPDRLLELRGLVAQELLASAEQGSVSERLRALCTAVPALDSVKTLLTESALPLGPFNALRLDGFDRLFLEVTGQCSLRCVHCYADAGPETGESLELSVCREILVSAQALGFRSVQLTGGDPLHCEHLEDLARLAQRLELAVEVYTNGLLLTERRLDGLADASVSFAFSLYSDDPISHDRATRSPGSHRGTVTAIDRVMARGLDFRVSVIDTHGQPGEADRAVEWLRARGVRRASAGGSVPVGRGQEVILQPSTLDPRYPRPVPGPLGRLCVTYRGQVVPCIFDRTRVLGDVRAQPLEEILKGPFPLDPERVSPATVLDQIARELRCGACRLTAFSLYLCSEPTHP